MYFCNLDGDQSVTSPEDETEEGWFAAGSWEPKEIPFTGVPGPTTATDHLGPDSDPVAFFQLFLSDELLQGIVDETNRYAEQCISQVCVFFVHSPCWCFPKVTTLELYGCQYSYLSTVYPSI